MKNNNYITVLGWMFNSLELNPTEALVYALIYGFSQDDVSEFQGSTMYIADTLNISKSSTQRTLAKLCEKKLILKTVTTRNKVVMNNYKVNQGVLKYIKDGIVKLNRGV